MNTRPTTTVKVKNNPGSEFRANYIPFIVTTAVFSIPALTGGLIWLYFLTPLPVFYYLLSLGPKQGNMIVARSAIIAGLVAIFVKVLSIQLFSFTMVPIGFVMASSLRDKATPCSTAFKSVICLTVIWILIGLTISSVQHVNLYSEIINNIDNGLAVAYESYRAASELPSSTLNEIETAFIELRKLVPRIFPGVILMTIIGTVWINLVLGDWLLKKKKTDIATWTDFRTWRLPEQLVWGIIIAGFLLFIPGSILKNVGLNGLLVMGLIYFFQGLAVITFLLDKWSVPTPVKFFLYILLVVQAYGMIILAGLGVADVWLNFRKPKPEPVE